MGRLPPDKAVVSGVVPRWVRDELLALQEERGLPNLSQTVGYVLTKWGEQSRAPSRVAGLRPAPSCDAPGEEPGVREQRKASGGATGPKSALASGSAIPGTYNVPELEAETFEEVAIVLLPWQEATGILQSVSRTDEGVTVTLQHMGSLNLFALSLEDVERLLSTSSGTAISVLRTDSPERPYAVRILGPAGAPRDLRREG